MFCLKCGNPIADGDQFCPKCGTPVESESRQPDESNVLIDSPAGGGETESENISVSEASAEPEKAAQSETSDVSGSDPRLRQEPMPTPVFNGAPPAEPIPVPPTYQAPVQPQYPQQPINQPQYRQMPNQPSPYPVPAPVAALPPAPPPFMKRSTYFKSDASEKIKGKVDTLSFLTGLGLGTIAIFIVSFLTTLLVAMQAEGMGRYRVFDIEVDTYTMITASIVALSICAVFAVLCILAAKTKHFVFYIFLILPSLLFTAASVYGFIVFVIINNFNFHSIYQAMDIEAILVIASNDIIAILLILFIAVSATALILSVISLILSIIVSGSYKKAKQEYIWRATGVSIQ